MMNRKASARFVVPDQPVGSSYSITMLAMMKAFLAQMTGTTMKANLVNSGRSVFC